MTALHGPPLPPAIAAPPRRSFASRVFGYDVFVSFALGPPPRGSQSYASDLARRLRERDFSVFFSEDEAPPGTVLDASLRGALKGSKMLVVVANRGTLAAPRWIRTEVEEFRRMHPGRPIVPISVDGALQDPALSEDAQAWLQFRDRIWLDEDAAAFEQGIASEPLVERLASAPARIRSNVAWRWVVRITLALLAALSIGLVFATLSARKSDAQARTELRRASSLKLSAQAQQRLTRQRAGGDERALIEVVAAARLTPGVETDGGLLAALTQRHALVRLADTGEAGVTIAYAPDGRSIAFGSGKGLLQLRDAVTLAPIGASLGRDEGGIVSLAWCGTGRRIVTGSTRGTARIWNVGTGATEGPILAGHQGMVTATCSPDGERIATVDSDFKVRLWGATRGEPIDAELSRTKDVLVSVGWRPDGARLVTGSIDGSLRWWNATTGESVGMPVQVDTGPVGIKFSRDGKLMLSYGMGHVLRLWDAHSGEPIGASSKPQPQMAAVALSSDGRRAVVAYADHSLRVLDTSNWAVLSGPLRGHQDVPMAVDISPDGDRIASVGATDRTLRLWDAAAGLSPGIAMQGEAVEIASFAFSPDGSRLATAGPQGVRMWDTNTRQVMPVPFVGHEGAVRALAFRPDGRELLTAGADATVRRWDAATGSPTSEPLGAEAFITVLAYGPDGQRFAADLDEGIRIWNAASGAAIDSPKGSAVGVIGLAFSPLDGSRVASIAANDKQVRLWDVATAQSLGTIDAGHESGLKHLAYHPSGRMLVAGGLRGLLRIWDLEAGQVIGAPLGDPLAGLEGSIDGLAYTLPDGRWIASAHGDGLRFWDAASGALIGTMPTERGKSVGPLAFSREGRRMAYLVGGALRILPAPEAWADEVCAKLTRNPSRREWMDWVSSQVDYVCPCPGLPVFVEDADASPPPRCDGAAARSVVW
jgi:WD40 repeat protein